MQRTIAYIFIAVVAGILCLTSSIGYASANTLTLEENVKAKVIGVISEEKTEPDRTASYTEQELTLKILTGAHKGNELTVTHVTDPQIGQTMLYTKGDVVVLNYAGDNQPYIVGPVRNRALYTLLALFIVVVLGIGKWKGLRSLIGLALSFVVILKGIIPPIINGANPLAVSFAGATGILALLLYTAEGWRPKTHIALCSITLSLLITFVLSLLFTYAARLTGVAQEEAQFLIGLVNGGMVDFRGLLLAGILIGAIGVLDDAIVAQIEAVKQIKQANPSYNQKQLFTASFAIGKTHLGAIVNTLFLVYAGASLPILILFYANRSEPLGFTAALNSELIATEIVRTLVGSIGVALSLPIATYLAAWWYARQTITATV